MLDPQAADEQRDQLSADAKGMLEAKGEVVHEAKWGLRKMAYEIERQGEADYRVYRFTGGKDLLDDLNHTLKITDGVLRFRIFKSAPDAPAIVPPDTEQIMRRDEDERGERGGRGGPRRGGRDGRDGGDRRERPAASPESTSTADSAPTTSEPATPAADAELKAPPADAQSASSGDAPADSESA